MSTETLIAKTDEEIFSCFSVLLLLRPHLKQENFLAQIRQQQAQAFQLVAWKENENVRSVIGFREAEFLI